MGFSRQEYWSGLPFPPPGDLPSTGIEPESPALQADALPSEPPAKVEFQRAGSNSCQSQKGEEDEAREKQPRNKSAVLGGRVLAPRQGAHIAMCL